MENKKKLIIASFIFFCLLIIFVIISKFVSKPQKKPFIPPISPRTTFIPWPSISSTITTQPTKVTDKIEIKGVKVRDFYQFATKPNDVGDMSIFENNNFQFVYQLQSSRFLISIDNSPFDKVRDEAEKKFLEILNISENDACNLSVFVITTYKVNPEYAGKKFNLSFCNED